MRSKFERLRQITDISRKASRRYNRLFPVVWLQVFWLKVRHDFFPWEIKEMGLLEKDLGELKVALKVPTRRLDRWLHKVNPNSRSGAINVKSRFYKTCAEHGIPIPEVYAVGRPDTAILEGLPERFLVKPAYNYSGRGICAFTRSGDGFTSFDGVDTDPESLVKFLEKQDPGDLVFQEWLRVHPSLKPIASKALITMRVVTFREGGTTRIVYAYLKQPGKDVLTDNWCIGDEYRGMLEVDINSGEPVAHWVENDDGWGVKPIYEMGHGETVSIHDVKVPHWPEVKALALRLGDTFPGLICPGWDIGLTDRGAVAIEGNSHWGFPIFPSGLHATLAVTGPLK